MMFDLFAVAADVRMPFALEIFERTASTPRVQQVVQLSLAPAFLLSGIGAVMNVIMSRMIWIAQRIERIEDKLEEQRTPRQAREHRWLMRRRKLAQGAIRHADCRAMGADDGAAGDGACVFPAGNAVGGHRRAGAEGLAG